MSKVKLIFPSGHLGSYEGEDQIATAMRLIAVAFGSPDEWSSKYGTQVSNDVFQMHRYCWCEREDCPWCVGCACQEGGPRCPWCRGEHRFAEYGALSPKKRPHQGAPLFWFKPSGFRLWWYKYIGRDMEKVGSLPKDWLAQVFVTHPSGMTVEAAARKLEETDEEIAASFAEMLRNLNIENEDPDDSPVP